MAPIEMLMRWFFMHMAVCAVALPGFVMAKPCMPPVAQDAPQFQALVDQSAIGYLLALGSGKWRLPSEQELSCHLGCPPQPGNTRGISGTPDGLYWIQTPDQLSRKFAWYLHVPSCRMLEYGDLVFPARLMLVQEQ